MKISVEVDCTPEEARRFFGLPDLAPVHEAYVETLRKAMSDGLSPDMIGDMMKSWGPMSDAGMKMWSQLFGQTSGTK